MLRWASLVPHFVLLAATFCLKNTAAVSTRIGANRRPFKAVLTAALKCNCLIIRTSDDTLRVWLPERKPRRSKARRNQLRKRNLRRRRRHRNLCLKKLRYEPSPAARRQPAGSLLPEMPPREKQPVHPGDEYAEKARS